MGYNAVQPYLKNCRPQIIKSIEDQLADTEGDNRPFDEKPIKTTGTNPKQKKPV